MTTKTINKIKIFVGVSALCVLFTFNLMHALNDYGVSNPNSTLHPQVYAQTNTAGGGGNSNAQCECSYAGGNTSNGHATWCPAHPNNGGGSSGPINPTPQPDPNKWTIMYFPCLDSQGRPTGRSSRSCIRTGFTASCTPTRC